MCLIRYFRFVALQSGDLINRDRRRRTNLHAAVPSLS